MSAELASRLAEVRARIAAACGRVGRSAEAVTLVAVSKGHPAEAIRAAYELGQRDFGENYVQEWRGKHDVLADLPELHMRLIGRLQRKKVKDVVPIVQSIDSVDSLDLAAVLSTRAQALGRNLAVLIQVNIDREPQKAGVLPEALPTLVAYVRALPALDLQGLMAIPRAVDAPEEARASFAALRALRDRHGLRELSMGMSADLEVAVEEGATLVRVGTAIFGERPKRPSPAD